MKKILKASVVIVFAAYVAVFSAFAVTLKNGPPASRILASSWGDRTTTTLTNLLTDLGTRTARIVLDGGDWMITTDFTVPTNITLEVAEGARLDITSGVTLTVNGPFDAPFQEVFTGSGGATGTARFLSWKDNWGSETQYNIGNGVLDTSTQSLNAAIENLENATNSYVLTNETRTVDLTGATLLADQISYDGGALDGIFLIANGNVGIGIATPTEALEVVGTIRTGQSTLRGDTSFLYVNESGTESVKIGGTVGNASEILSVGSELGGTTEINLIRTDSITDNDDIAEIWFSGLDGGLGAGALIKAVADGSNWGAGDHPTRLEFHTTLDGSAVASNRMTIKNDGSVGIGTDAPSSALDVIGDVEVNGTNVMTEIGLKQSIAGHIADTNTLQAAIDLRETIASHVADTNTLQGFIDLKESIASHVADTNTLQIDIDLRETIANHDADTNTLQIAIDAHGGTNGAEQVFANNDDAGGEDLVGLGNVGIGTNATAALLEVNGTMQVNDLMCEQSFMQYSTQTVAIGVSEIMVVLGDNRVDTSYTSSASNCIVATEGWYDCSINISMEWAAPAAGDIYMRTNGVLFLDVGSNRVGFDFDAPNISKAVNGSDRKMCYLPVGASVEWWIEADVNNDFVIKHGGVRVERK